MNGKCFLCALLWACNTEWMGNAFYVLYYGHVILNEWMGNAWEMLLCALCALLWACNTEWMGNAFLFFIMDM